ncbi:hypothetical protein JCM14124_30740 [Humidesulfovibrio idahonensis]
MVLHGRKPGHFRGAADVLVPVLGAVAPVGAEPRPHLISVQDEAAAPGGGKTLRNREAEGRFAGPGKTDEPVDSDA